MFPFYIFDTRQWRFQRKLITRYLCYNNKFVFDVQYSPNRPIANCMRPRAMALSWGCTHRSMSNMLPTSDVEWMNTNNENKAMYQKPESSQSSLHNPGSASVALPAMHWQFVYYNEKRHGVNTRGFISNKMHAITAFNCQLHGVVDNGEGDRWARKTSPHSGVSVTQTG